jgi:transposase-like protein
VRRVEVIIGKERRRQWTDEEKRRLVAEALLTLASYPSMVASHLNGQGRGCAKENRTS